MRVYRTSPHSQSWPHSPGNFFAHREQNDVFESMAAFNGIRPNLANPGETAERLAGLSVTSDFFNALGVQPSDGRVFTSEEHEPGADRVAVLSPRFWMSRYGGIRNSWKRDAVDGQDVTIVGVMPPSVRASLLWAMWMCGGRCVHREQRGSRGSNYLRSLARLKPGVTRQQLSKLWCARG